LIAAETSESNLTFELEHDSEIIADNLHIKGTGDKSGMAIVEEIMRFIVGLGLFSESSGHIFCFKLLKRLDSSMSSNPRFRRILAEAKESHDAVMMESCQSHDTVMQDENRIDEMRIDENRKEEIRPFFAQMSDSNESPRLKGAYRIEKARSAWNAESPQIGPACRLMAITFKPDDTADCLRIMNAYTDDEIAGAMENYLAIRQSEDHEVKAPYQSFVGFIRGGVEKFVSEADPWTAYKRALSFDERQEAENRKNLIKAGIIQEDAE
jgi:hypothetical protein